MREIYENWCENAKENDLNDELMRIRDNNFAIEERFYKELEFGTAGLRGIMGAGTNRMNIYVVRRATQGMANYIKKVRSDKKSVLSVAISYDSRNKSSLFAKEAARVLAANGIKVYLSRELEPTPVLSFFVRHYKCIAGIMITASHNPAEYNGYKVYGQDGCQMTGDLCNLVYEEICKLGFFDVDVKDFEESVNEKLIEYVSEDVYDSYIDCVKRNQINPGICYDSNLTVAYTPLNGAGNKLVRRVLSEIGAADVSVVEEQSQPDGQFTTCRYPNPEIDETLSLGVKLAKKINADILLATDPDADRVGLAVAKGDGEYIRLTGNETGILLVDYILSEKIRKGTMPQNPIVVKTIVSSILVDRIAEKYGVEVKNVLTGFKYIGEVILNLEGKREENRFVFGFEESCGYLSGTYVRDKDAVLACMLITEMASYYKKQNKTLNEVIQSLYEEYGYYLNTTLNFEFAGTEGVQKMTEIMTHLRAGLIKEIAGFPVTKIADYLLGKEKDLTLNTEKNIDLPLSDVISFQMKGNHAAIIRPSGTEPKIKLYITAVGKTKAEAEGITKEISSHIKICLGIV